MAAMVNFFLILAQIILSPFFLFCLALGFIGNVSMVLGIQVMRICLTEKQIREYAERNNKPL